jgi:hypothetical protein
MHIQSLLPNLGELVLVVNEILVVVVLSVQETTLVGEAL